MFHILQTGSEFKITNYPWDENGYRPNTKIRISYDEKAFYVVFTSYEKEVVVLHTKHNTNVYKDSCMELFVQFDPVNDQRYINIEANAKGIVFNAVTTKRGDYSVIPTSDIILLNVKSQIFSDRWILTYQIPISYIKKYVPTYQHQVGNIIRANFCKCGDETKYPHYGCFSNIVCENPDFHRPEYFAEFCLA